MKVRDIMRPARWTIGPDATLDRAERMMVGGRLHQLLVVDAGAIAGVLSERDVLDCQATARTDEDWWRVPVRRAMRGIPATAGPDESVGNAINRLAKSPVDVLPIVEHGFLIGQITATDLFEAEGSIEPKAQPLTADRARYPFLRASIERGVSRHAPPVPPESAPSRAILAAASELAARSRTDHPATASEIVALLGEIEPLTLEKLIATRATIGEVAEAVSAIEDEDAFGEVHHAPSTPQEAEVRAILEDLVFENFEERESEREIART